MDYFYILTVHNKENDQLVCQIESESQESLEEQLHKIAPAIKKFEETKKAEDEDGHEIPDDEI